MKLPKEYLYDRPEFSYDKWDTDAFLKASEENLAHLFELEKKAKEKFMWVGSVLRIPVADGVVFYQVVETKEKTAIVSRCAGICLDLYEDMILGQGCELPLEKVIQMIESKRAMDRLFARKN